MKISVKEKILCRLLGLYLWGNHGGGGGGFCLLSKGLGRGTKIEGRTRREKNLSRGGKNRLFFVGGSKEKGVTRI